MLNSQVLKPETVRQIGSLKADDGMLLGNRATKIADRWASGWTKATQAMEADGTLLPALAKQAELEAMAISDNRIAGANQHLADHEILEMVGIPPEPPSPLLD